MPTFSPPRAALIMLLLVFGLAGMTTRVAYLQTYGRAKIINWSDRQQHITEKLISRRGSIYDANGCLMAGTIQTRNLYVDPKFLRESYLAEGQTTQQMDKATVQMEEDLRKLASFLDKNAFELQKKLFDKQDARYLRLAENLDEKACEEIQRLNIPGIGVETQNQRFYPMGSIAAHVLGGVGKDDTGLAEKGLEGVELRFNKELAGKDGHQRVVKDARRRAIAVAAEDYFPPQHGHHLILTLDANVQMISEQELAAVCKDFRANRGECIVIDPKSGEVLALANWPAYNPQIMEDSTPELRRNRCLTDPYEPGSTFKPFMAGPAVRDRMVKLGDVLPIKGPHFVTSYGRKVTDVHGYDQLAVWDVLVKSSNIGMCMLAAKMGNQKVYDAVRGFGFGRPTGIELPGEDPGLVNPLRKWTKYSLESVAQGYEVMVTPIQLARGFCAYANGGRLVTPRIVRGTLEADGHLAQRYEADGLQVMPQALDRNTSLEMRRVLADTVVRGTATRARSKVWNIFGKTGTAHVSGGRAGYNDSKYTSSFMAGAPYEDPRVVVVMIIHEPDKAAAEAKGVKHYGGAVAAPGTSRVIERTLAYMAVPPSVDLPVPPAGVASVLYNYNEKLYKIGTTSASSSASVRE